MSELGLTSRVVSLMKRLPCLRTSFGEILVPEFMVFGRPLSFFHDADIKESRNPHQPWAESDEGSLFTSDIGIVTAQYVILRAVFPATFRYIWNTRLIDIWL